MAAAAVPTVRFVATRQKSEWRNGWSYSIRCEDIREYTEGGSPVLLEKYAPGSKEGRAFTASVGYRVREIPQIASFVARNAGCKAVVDYIWRDA